MDAENLTRAESAVIRRLPDGTVHRVYACAAHVPETGRRLGGGDDLEVTSDGVTPVHGCKGCLEDWDP